MQRMLRIHRSQRRASIGPHIQLELHPSVGGVEHGVRRDSFVFRVLRRRTNRIESDIIYDGQIIFLLAPRGQLAVFVYIFLLVVRPLNRDVSYSSEDANAGWQ